MSREVCGICWCPYDEDTGECACACAPQSLPAQKPIAWYHVPYPNNGVAPMVSLSRQREPSMYGAVVPLYLAPPQRKPLTEEEIMAAYTEFMLYEEGLTPSGLQRVTRAIERAHGIGGQP